MFSSDLNSKCLYLLTKFIEGSLRVKQDFVELRKVQFNSLQLHKSSKGYFEAQK